MILSRCAHTSTLIRLATGLPFLPHIAVLMFWSSQCSWAGAMPIHSLQVRLQAVDRECWLEIHISLWLMPRPMRDGLVLHDVGPMVPRMSESHLGLELCDGYGTWFAKAGELRPKVSWDSWDKAVDTRSTCGKGMLGHSESLYHCSDAHHHCRKQRRV